MRHDNTVFHQLTKHIPWDVFDAAVETHKADHRVRTLRTRDQFVSLLYGQVSGASSLRGIEDGLMAQRARLYHLGARPVHRSSLADANAKRPSAVYESVFAALVVRAKPGLRRTLRPAVRLLDSSKVLLSGRSGGWVKEIKQHHAAKLHVLYCPGEAMPVQAKVTAHQVSDLRLAERLPIDPGATYVFDLAYYKYAWWKQLDAAGCRFVTRMKTTTQLRGRQQRPALPGSTTIVSDATGQLGRHVKTGRNPYTATVREVVVRRQDGQGKVTRLRLITNDLKAPAQEIADLYKTRWQVELFFRWIKQTLAIRHFIGTSENAVRTQIFIALIAFLLLRAAHKAQNAIKRPTAFARLVRLNIMHRKPINALKDPPETPTKYPNQLSMHLAPG